MQSGVLDDWVLIRLDRHALPYSGSEARPTRISVFSEPPMPADPSGTLTLAAECLPFGALQLLHAADLFL